MIEFELDHDESPPELREINAKLIACFKLTDTVELAERFNHLVALRADLIESLLSSLPEKQKVPFSSKELEVNQVLHSLACNLLDSAKKEIVQYMRGRAAIKKYT